MFFGHVISAQDIVVSPKKIEAMVDWPRLRTMSEVRGLLGLAGYYHIFVQNFLPLVMPMTKLLKKGIEFSWIDTCEESFREVKERLILVPILTLPTVMDTFVVFTYALRKDYK